MNEKRYCLVRDDSAHWYLCPEDRRLEAEEIFEALENGEEVDEPNFVIQIDGPHRLTFTDPEY